MLKMFWEDYVYLIPFIITCLGILHAHFLIRRLLRLRRSGWKPPCSKNSKETILQTSIDNAIINHTNSNELEMFHQTLEVSKDDPLHENETEVKIKGKQRKMIQIPLPDVPIGPTIFEIMEGKAFTSTCQLHGHGFLSKVLDLFMCQGAELDDFRIAAGVGPKAGRMFDDIAFQYGDEDKKFCFVRIAETEVSSSCKITARDLKSSKDPTFSLFPLFESYIGIRQQFTEAGMDSCNIGFLMVFTNAIFEPSKFEFLGNAEEPSKECKRKSKISLRKFEAPGHPFLPSDSYQIRIPDKKLKHYTCGDEALKALFVEFLDKLVFAVGQLGGSQIDEVIIGTLNQRFNLVESRFIFHEMLGMIRNMPKQPTEVVVAHDLKVFLEEIRKRLQRIYFSGVVLENHCNDLCSEDYFKTYEPIAGVLQARTGSSDASVAPFICISTKTTALTSLKVAHCLQRIFGSGKELCERFAVLDTLSLLKNRERVEDTFRCRKEFVLAIKWSEIGAKMKAEVDVLVAKLIDVATNPRAGEKKTIVLIEDMTKDFTDIKIYADACNLLEDQCEFMNFRDEIKTQIMKDKFQVQDQVIALSKVITGWELKSLDSRVRLLNQIIEDGQKCFSSSYKI